MKRKSVILAVVAFTVQSLIAQTPVTNKMDWWKEAKFGLFIHWGVYSVPAGSWNGKPVPGIGEWIMNRGKIPVADYQKLPAQFNPVKFNAEEWVKLAKDAGMKYIVITSKHHDGFAMFKSNASSYNIVDATPFKRDVIKELAEACKNTISNLVYIILRHRIGVTPAVPLSVAIGIVPKTAVWISTWMK